MGEGGKTAKNSTGFLNFRCFRTLFLYSSSCYDENVTVKKVHKVIGENTLYSS